MSFVVVLVVLLAACQDREPAPTLPQVGEAFTTVITPPRGALVSRSGSSDALQLTFQSGVGAEQVAEFYRGQFSREGWRILSDLVDTSGVIAMHVEWDATRQPMWVRIQPVGNGSTINLVGAVPASDSAYQARRQSGADSANTLVPR
ncbi:MAG TPA: hypothetical protein VFS94_04695 [Gemmatimonadales bacterium]|nr:hypothetical protein [Gemmatimonadales bacterium]